MTVFIVGVGPGDAELMTLKAARLLRDADAVVHDRLIGSEVLDYVSPVAERHDVGKTPGRLRWSPAPRTTTSTSGEVLSPNSGVSRSPRRRS